MLLKIVHGKTVYYDDIQTVLWFQDGRSSKYSLQNFCKSSSWKTMHSSAKNAYTEANNLVNANSNNQTEVKKFRDFKINTDLAYVKDDNLLLDKKWIKSVITDTDMQEEATDADNTYMTEKTIDGKEYYILNNVQLYFHYDAVGEGEFSIIKRIYLADDEGEKIGNLEFKQGSNGEWNKEYRDITTNSEGVAKIKLRIPKSNIVEGNEYYVEFDHKYKVNTSNQKYIYSGVAQRYVHKGAQRLVTYKVKRESKGIDKEEDENSAEIPIKLKSTKKARIEIVKYVKEIRDAENNIKYNSDETWKENMKYHPTIKVDKTKDVDADNRYSKNEDYLDELIANKELYVSNGDKITYAFRVYNVGDAKTNFNKITYDISSPDIEDDEEDETPADSEDEKKVIFNDNFLIDWPDKSYLLFQPSSGWTKQGDSYIYDILNLGDIDCTDNDKVSKTDSWSKEVTINFEVNVPESKLNEIAQSGETLEIQNNYLKVPYEQHDKDLLIAKYIKEIIHADGTKTQIDTRPIVKEVSGKFTITAQDTSNIKIVNGDKITYAFRLYNVGEEKITLENITEQYPADKNYLVKNVLHDKYGDYLVYQNTGQGWVPGTGEYTKTLTGDINNRTNENKNNVDQWSKEYEIQFQVQIPQNVIDNAARTAQTIYIQNNELKVPLDVPGNPKLIITKYIESIDGNNVSNGPSITINMSEDVNSSNRYNLGTVEQPSQQIKNGSVITYAFRIYNISNDKIKLTNEKKYNSSNKDWLKQNVLYDTPGDYLEIIDNNWRRSGNSYIRDLTGIELEPTDGDISHIDKWSYKTTIKFEVKVPNSVLTQAANEGTTIYIENHDIKVPLIPPPPTPEDEGWTLKGKVFIDLNSSKKWTDPRDNVLGSEDILVEGIKVDLYRDNTWINSTYTDSNGEYRFNDLIGYDIWIRHWEIVGYDADWNAVWDWVEWGGPHSVNKARYEVYTSNTDYWIYRKELKEYRVKFTYNGQEYENITYNADGYAGNGSYATDENRSGFNNSFPEINGSNSTTYSLKISEDANTSEPGVVENGGRAVLALEKGTKRDILNVSNGFGIEAYSGSSGWYSSNGVITVETSYKDHVNLGLVRRHFDLELTNDLHSLDVYINGTKQTENAINGRISKEHAFSMSDLEREAYFKAEDYENTEVSEPLNIWVHYKVNIKNVSRDKFIGKVGSINYFFEDRFTGEIKVNGVSLSGAVKEDGLWKATIPINRDIYKDGEYGFVISLHLTREEIAQAILNNESGTMNTFYTVAEIANYTTRYDGDVYNNGHTGNAGKIDEDSNAGTVKASEYLTIENMPNGNPNEIKSKVFALRDYLEDDGSRAMGIKLKRDGHYRTLDGYVFEDKTGWVTINGVNTRRGNGIFDSDEHGIPGVVVKLIDDNNPGLEYFARTNSDGKYAIYDYTAGSNYRLEFEYGDGATDIYNAQDYKSTIDTFARQYEGPDVENNVLGQGGFAKEGRNNYWYHVSGDGKYSVAKDIDTKMSTANFGNTEQTLTNETAKALEDYANIYGNKSTTEKMYIPVRYEANKGVSADWYYMPNIDLGLAERPRSELTIHKQVARVTIKSSDGRTLIDGTQGVSENSSISWMIDNYVQPIVDESLIYGSTITITYKMWIENTGELDYMSTGAPRAATRRFYDYGGNGAGQSVVTTKANKVIDYIDENLLYDKDTQLYTSSDVTDTNQKYWGEKISGITGISDRLDDGIKPDVQNWSTKVVTTDDNPLVKAPPLTPKQNTLGSSNDDYAYITISKNITSANENDLLTYNNYVEIIEATNSAGRRSYTSKNTIDFVTPTNRLLSDMTAMRGNPDINENPLIANSKNGDEYILTIPGNLNPKTIYTILEPDATSAEEIQVIQPFGKDKRTIIIWTTIGIISTAILAGGVYLIKRYVLK